MDLFSEDSFHGELCVRKRRTIWQKGKLHFDTPINMKFSDIILIDGNIKYKGWELMNIYYVYQNKTKKQESDGGYLWSPQKNKIGGNNVGYTNMSNVKKGDIILHGANQETYAISIAIKDCYAAEQPSEIKKISKEQVWNNEGYRVDSHYTIFKTSLNMRSHFEWFSKNREQDSAFTVKGEGKQIYLSKLSERHFEYILNQLSKLPQDTESYLLMKSIMKEGLEEDLLEYSADELDSINKIVDEESDRGSVPKWKGKSKEKEFVSPSGTGKETPKRTSNVAANALKIANYLCEYDIEHKVFLRKAGKANYTEPHHLIPISKHKDFNYSLDVEENIVSLCSHCHNLLHYGRLEDKLSILENIYGERKEALKSVGLELDSLDDLKKYYI